MVIPRVRNHSPIWLPGVRLCLCAVPLVTGIFLGLCLYGPPQAIAKPLVAQRARHVVIAQVVREVCLSLLGVVWTF